MADFDCDYLLTLLRGHTRIPAIAGFDDEDCLRDLTSVLHGYILPLVKAEWQEHWLAAESATTSLSVVDGQAEYELPRRTVAGSLRTVVLVGPDGRARVPLEFAEIDSLERSGAAEGIPRHYGVRSNRLVLYPTPRNMSTYTLRLPMLVRPARLVVPSACAVVTAVTPGSGNVVLTTTAAPMALQALTSLDVVRNREPFENVVLEAAANWGSSTSVTLTGVASTAVSVGDYVAQAGTSPFPQCPVELLDLLALRTAIEHLAGSGDTDVAGAKAASLQERRRDATVTVKPRSGDPRTQQNGMAKWRFGNGTMDRLTNRGGTGFW